MVYFIDRAVRYTRCHGCDNLIGIGHLRVSVNPAGTFLRHLRCRKYEEIPTLEKFRPTTKYGSLTPQDKQDLQKFIDSLNKKKRKIHKEIEEEESNKKRRLNNSEKQTSPKPCNFDTCSTDILGVIFRFLDDLDDIRSSLQVNKKWNSAIDNNEALWENLYHSRITSPDPNASKNFKDLFRKAVQNNKIIPSLHYTVRKTELPKYGLGEKDIIKYEVRYKVKKEFRSQMYFDYAVDMTYYAMEDIKRAQKKKWNDLLEDELLENNLSLEHKHNSHFEDWLQNGSSKATLRALMKSFLEKNGKNTEEEPASELPTVSEINKMTVKQLKENLAKYGITPQGVKYDLQAQLRKYVSQQEK